MRARYRKRMKFGILRINLSRSGVGWSWGVRGFRVTHSSTGQHYLTLSLPGTGLSWQRALRPSRRRLRGKAIAVHPPMLPHSPTPVPPQTSPSPLPSAGAPAPASVNGMPWWKQTGIKGGP